MTIRPATPAHLDAIADLADAQRLRLDGWHPELWPLSLSARRRHATELATVLHDPRTHGLVAADHRLRGYVLATELPPGAAHAPTWAVTEMGVSKPKRWDTVGRVLLAALADAAVRHGIEEIVVPCPAGDRRRHDALVGARLRLQCWFRSLVLAGSGWPERFVASGLDEPGLPLPHLHALVGATVETDSVTAPGAHALLSGTLPPTGTLAMADGWSLADPVIASDEESLWHVLDEVERRCRARGDRVLTVAVGPGEEPLDAVLDRRGYGCAMDWFSLRPTK